MRQVDVDVRGRIAIDSPCASCDCGPAAAITDFNLSKLERVMSGAGKVAALGHELERRGLKRTVVVTGKTLGGSALLEKVTGAAGARCVAVFKGARQHVPRSSVHELQALIERENADSLIGFGGGSPIDTCKVASHPFLEKREIIQIAIPTTLSAAEYTYGGGVTDEKTLVKSVVSDPRLQPRTVMSDPELTLETPEWLWVATGMRALDHAIETIYAKRHHPLSDALGAKAISLLVEHLKPSIETSTAEQLAHRRECQFAAWFSIFGSMNTRFGISHLLGHQIGPRWNIAHGITSCITLPTLCGLWRESRLSDLGLSPRDLAFRSIGRTQRRARSRARITPHSSLRASTCRIV
ncbi:MAG TPA: iron-containing alcohol dehydrogenase [Candidatus Acidoferrum sp.]|nr:iron-containing alcohol dehydrogenase [Candidatus Acidoferrum sp.]